MNDSGTTIQDAQSGSAPRSRARWWLHLLVIGAYPLAIGLLGWNQPATREPVLTRTSQGLLFTSAIQLAVFGAVFLLGWFGSRASAQDLLLRWRGGFWPLPLGIAYSVGLRLGLAFVALMTFAVLLLARVVTPDQVREFAQANRPDVEAMVDVAALRTDTLYFWLTITFVSFVLAGLREELWRSAVLAGCRKLWPQRFSSRGGQVIAIALIAVVFGLGHLTMGPIAVLAAIVLGLGLGVIMVFHGSIWPAVIAHGAFNATTFALLPIVLDLPPGS